MALGLHRRLPLPVERYLNRILRGSQLYISEMRMQQHGRLRTNPHGSRWLRFDAHHTAFPRRTEFIWDARVRMFPGIHVSVRDSYIFGKGAGESKLLSLWTIERRAGDEAMNSGSLHRYLAEAVWYPTALLPSEYLEWSSIDDGRALATLSHAGTTVSLEFWFGENDEVTGIFSPGRWGLFDGGYKQVPWEGHFRDYTEVCGIRIPAYGEVGWYVSGQWNSVWEAHIDTPHFVFDREGESSERSALPSGLGDRAL